MKVACMTIQNALDVQSSDAAVIQTLTVMYSKMQTCFFSFLHIPFPCCLLGEDDQ